MFAYTDVTRIEVVQQKVQFHRNYFERLLHNLNFQTE